jgi:hypothetical protein
VEKPPSVVNASVSGKTDKNRVQNVLFLILILILFFLRCKFHIIESVGAFDERNFPELP